MIPKDTPQHQSTGRRHHAPSPRPPQLHGHSTHPSESSSSRHRFHLTSSSTSLTLTHPPILLLFPHIHPPNRLSCDCNNKRNPPPPPRASKNALQVTLCFTFLEHAPALFSPLTCNNLATCISSSSLLLLSADTPLLPLVTPHALAPHRRAHPLRPADAIRQQSQSELPVTDDDPITRRTQRIASPSSLLVTSSIASLMCA